VDYISTNLLGCDDVCLWSSLDHLRDVVISSASTQEYDFGVGWNLGNGIHRIIAMSPMYDDARLYGAILTHLYQFHLTFSLREWFVGIYGCWSFAFASDDDDVFSLLYGITCTSESSQKCTIRCQSILIV